MEDDIRVNGIPRRLLGQTGERVTVIGLGGHAIGKIGNHHEAIRVIRTAIEEGVNFLDNARCYHDGKSELLMGDALRGGYRRKVFLMTKNHGRDPKTFQEQLDESLGRLNTDYVDLLQFHNIVAEHDPERIFSDGALEAALEAKKQGKIRFIGFTGHHWPHLFKEMLERSFSWDTVQHPVNPLDAQYRSFSRDILPMLNERGIGAIAMKIFSGGHLFQAGVTLEEAIRYALSQPVSTLVLGIDSVEYLSQNLAIIRRWKPMSVHEQEGLEKRVSSWAKGGQLEKYKTDPE